MNIYKRQMRELGLNLDQYSKFLDIPKSIVKKIVDENGEVVEDMEVNNFLRKNLFGKHQEVENNKEEKKTEALNIKLMRGENSYETKKQWLLEKYPYSEEVLWYVNEYNKKEYFKKYNIQNRADLMRRYKFTCNEGRLKNQKEVGKSTLERLTEKKYNELGTQSAYSLICQLYDCLALGNIEKPIVKIKNNNHKFGQKNKIDKDLLDWYKNFDFRKFLNDYNITQKELYTTLNIPRGTISSILDKRTTPTERRIKQLKEYVEKNEIKTVTETGDVKVLDTSIDEEILEIMQPEQTQEDLLRKLLKDRLTEEEKIIIKLFGGRI